MLRWILAVMGAALGAACGLFAPVLVARALGAESGSYEDFLKVWLAAVPGGFVLGAVAGARLGRHLQDRATRRV